MGEFDYFDEDDETAFFSKRTKFSVPLSIATLFLWTKFLYFLRIFDKFNFYVVAITETVKKMIYFLIIIMLINAAFGESFKVMSLANKEEDKFINNRGILDFFNNIFYVYLHSVGEFDLDNLGKVAETYNKILFFINTLFTTVVTMNLFIAIISATFSEISGNSTRASYREKAGMIAENEFLISEKDKSDWCSADKYICYAQKLGIKEGEGTKEYQQRQMNDA